MSGSPLELVFQELATFVYENAEHCHDCTRVVDASQAAAPSDMPKTTFDVSVTLDGAILATDAFRSACEFLPGIEFAPLDGADDLWLVEVDQVVVIEPFDSHVRTGPICATCGEPRYVVRSGPLRLDPDERFRVGVSRTELGFGDTADFGSSQPVRLRPHVVIDRTSGRALKDAALLGVHLIAQA